MNNPIRPVTTRVLLHRTASGQMAVGVVISEWQGAVKVSRRLARLTPVAPVLWYPPGVDRAIVEARDGLSQLIDMQRTDWPSNPE